MTSGSHSSIPATIFYLRLFFRVLHFFQLNRYVLFPIIFTFQYILHCASECVQAGYVSGAREYPIYFWFHLLFVVHPSAFVTLSFQLTRSILLQIHISKASRLFRSTNENVKVSAAYKTNAACGNVCNSFRWVKIKAACQ